MKPTVRIPLIPGIEKNSRVIPVLVSYLLTPAYLEL